MEETNELDEPPFFSVVIPLYNKAPSIGRAVTSVLDQTLGDFELIIVDDASTDSGITRIEKLVEARIRLFRREEPGPGGYAARNLGIREARGEWIAFLDADDEWYPEHLQRLAQAIEEFPDTSFIGSGWETRSFEDPVDERYYDAHRGRGTHEISLEIYLESCRLGLRPVCSSVACVKRSALLEPDLFPAGRNVRRGGDLHAWLSLICRLKRMLFSDHIGAIYHGDAPNRVTRTAPDTPELMSRSVYRELAKDLSRGQRRLLKRYFNHRLGRAWARSTVNRDPYFFLPSKLYWSAEPIGCAARSAVALVPRPLLRRANEVRRKWLPKHS